MPDRLEGRLRWLFGVVAVVLVATGACALLAASHAGPAQTGAADVAGIFAVGAAVSSVIPALLAAGIALVLALAALVIWSPRRCTHLMPPFVLASLAAALAFATSLLDAAQPEPAARAALLGLLVSLLLASLTALGWLRLWLAPQPGVATATRDAELLDALLSTLAPAGEGTALGATDPLVRAGVLRAFAACARPGRPVLRVVLRVLDARSLVKHRTGFAHLAPAAREALLAGLATSRFARLRALRTQLDRIVLTTFYGDERVRSAIGYDAAWLRDKLEAGPNAEAHRARREEAARLAAQAEAEQLGPAAEVAADAGPAGEDAAPAIGSVASAGAVAQPAAEEVPFDRAWTLGVPQEPVAPAALASVMRVVRSSGPTRP